MLRTRKRWISLLVTLAMLVAFCLPAGTAFAADPVTFSYAKATVVDGKDNNLGWVKMVIEDEQSVADVYVTITLPDGATFDDFNSDSGAFANATPSSFVETGSAGSSFLKVSDDSVTFIARPDVDTIKLRFLTTSNTDVKIDDSKITGNVDVTITAKAVDSNGFELWTETRTLTLGTLEEKGATVTADSPKLNSFGFYAVKTGATITLEETSKGSITGSVYLELPDNYIWAFAAGQEFKGPYGLTLKLKDSTNGTQRAEFSVISTSSFADSVEITPKFQIKPGAEEADVVVNVSFTADIDDADVTIAKFGAAPVKVSVVDSSDLATAYIASDSVTVNSIKLESDLNLKAGDTVELALPDGFEWAGSAPDWAGLKYETIYSDNRKIYAEIENENDEYTLNDLRVKVTKDAEPGPLYVTVSGTAGADATVQVAEVKVRGTAEATPTNVKIGGLNVAAGDITITEAGKDTFYSNGIKIELPTGVTFADDIEWTLNGVSQPDLSVSGKTYAEFTFNRSSAKVDKIVLSNIKYNIDTRVTGDIKVKVGGSAFGADGVCEVVNAKAVSATAGSATMKIGDPKIVINGVEKIMEAAPYIKNQRTYVSVTYAALACGVAPENIMWDGVNRTVTVIKGDRVAQFKIGSKVMTLNGAVITMDTAPEIVNARTMMPVTWVALALGGNTAWDAATQTVTVTVN